jgi:hypothetical protein
VPTILLFIHIVLCAFAICSGALVLSNLLSNRLAARYATFFLRCSLGSSIAALLLQLHHLLPSQKVAMISVYGAGLAILAWRKFHLRGAWRGAFAFTIALVLYLNILMISIQIFAYPQRIDASAPGIFRVSQSVLFTIFVFLGVGAAERFSASRESRRGRAHGSGRLFIRPVSGR